MKAVVVDDEPYCCEALTLMLKKCCPQVKIISCAKSGQEGIALIEEEKPHLVFLDIELPEMNGFEMLSKLKFTDFDLIFTTAYDHYAMKAVKYSAIDYLLKPVDIEELQQAIKKLDERLHRSNTFQLHELLKMTQSLTLKVHKIALPTLEGFHMVQVDDIISCTSDSNYTILFLLGNQKLIVSKTLKEIEESLDDFSFIRVHHSHVVNINQIVKYVKGNGGYLVMSDGTVVNVSRSRKDFLTQRLFKKRLD